MVLRKVSEMLRKSIPVGGNDLMIVDKDDPEALVSKKSSIEAIALAAKALGGIGIHEGVTEQLGITTTPEKLTLFNDPQGFNSPALNVTPDKANNEIIVANAGIYDAVMKFSASGTTNTDFTLTVYVNGIATKIVAQRTTGAVGSVMNANAGFPLQLAAGDVLTIYVNSDDAGGADLRCIYMYFYVTR